jgi:AbrB family looped-hinge helix DNA binding protein
MQRTVKVTRKGQITIPTKIGAKLGIKEGDELAVEIKDQQIIFKSIPRLEDCAGILQGTQKVGELKKEIDRLREEY